MCPFGTGPVEGVHSSRQLTMTKRERQKSKYNNTSHFKYQLALGGNTAVIASLTNVTGTDLKLEQS
jgi:hypothetical protein